MTQHRDTPPLSPDDNSFGRLRWIVALALAGLIAVGAAFQLNATKVPPDMAPIQDTTPAQ
jgi:hypothetical protein